MNLIYLTKLPPHSHSLTKHSPQCRQNAAANKTERRGLFKKRRGERRQTPRRFARYAAANEATRRGAFEKRRRVVPTMPPRVPGRAPAEGRTRGTKKAEDPPCGESSAVLFELLPRVELGTSSLPRMRSTTELKQPDCGFLPVLRCKDRQNLPNKETFRPLFAADGADLTENRTTSDAPYSSSTHVHSSASLALPFVLRTCIRFRPAWSVTGKRQMRRLSGCRRDTGRPSTISSTSGALDAGRGVEEGRDAGLVGDEKLHAAVEAAVEVEVAHQGHRRSARPARSRCVAAAPGWFCPYPPRKARGTPSRH